MDDSMQRVTYGELRQKIIDVGRHLSVRQLVVIEMGNNMDSVIFYLGCLFRGTVAILVHENLSEFELSEYIEKFEPEYLFLSKGTNELILERTGYQVVDIGSKRVLFEKGVKMQKEINPNLAILLPTSGTSHVSKLVRISRRNLLDNTKNICRALEIESTDVAITSLPLSYTYGLSVLNTHLLRHGTVLLTGKSVVQKSFFEFANVNGATSFAGVPYTYELLEKSGHLQKDNSIQKYTQAGGRLSLNLCDKFAKYCKENDKTFTIMYGQTEATARMTVLPWQEIERKRGSAGKVICGGKLWIDNGLHNEVEGEIFYAGKNVSMGYCYGVDDLARGDDNQGVLKTGDYGYLDKEGFLYLSGRRNDFVKLFGKRINLNSIERMIDEKFGFEVIVRAQDDGITILYEEQWEKVFSLKQEQIRGEIHLPHRHIKFKKVESFLRNRNGKLCKGERHGDNAR